MFKKYKVSVENMVHSDHDSLEISLKLLFRKKVQKHMRKVYLHKFMNKVTKLLFSKNVTIKSYDCADIGHDKFYNNVSDSAKDSAYEKHE